MNYAVTQTFLRIYARLYSCAGIIDGMGYIGGALATWGAGKISDTLGWSQVFVLLAVFAMFSMLAALRMSLTFRKKIN